MGPPEQQMVQHVVETGGASTELWVAVCGAVAAVATLGTAWLRNRRARRKE